MSRWDTEDWSLALAELHGVGSDHMDLNDGASESSRRHYEQRILERTERLKNVVGQRDMADTDALRKQTSNSHLNENRQDMLPEGWKQVKTESGNIVYENTYTEERQAWLPMEPARPTSPEQRDSVKASSSADATEAMKERNRRALAARKAKNQGFLPEGWKKVPSRSRPGEYVFENVHTGERVAWYPIVPARRQAMPSQTVVSRNAEKAVARFEYAAATQEEIDIKPGDKILVEHKAPNGWWVGVNERTGGVGLFPGSFVELTQ